MSNQITRVTVARENVIAATHSGMRYFVVLDHPLNEGVRKVVVTAWDDTAPLHWECSHENADPRLKDINENILQQVEGQTFHLRNVISEA